MNSKFLLEKYSIEEIINLLKTSNIINIDDIINNNNININTKEYIINSLNKEQLKSYITINNKLIRYIKDSKKNNIRQLTNIAIKNGYKPNIEEIKKYPNLKNNYYIISYIINNVNPKIIEEPLINNNLEIDQLIVEALYNGYEINDNYFINNNISSTNKTNHYSPFLKLCKSLILIEEIIINKNLDKYKDKFNPSLLRNKSILALKQIIDNNDYSKDTIDMYIDELIHNNRIVNYKVLDLIIDSDYILNKNIIKLISKYKNKEIIKSLMIKVINKDKNLIKYYRGFDEDIYKNAIDNGYIPTEEDLINNYYLSGSIVIMKKAIDINVNMVKYHQDYDEYIYKYAINKDANVIKYYKGNNIDIYKYAIDKDVNVIKLYNNLNEKIFEYAIKKGYIPTEEDLINNYYLSISKVIMIKSIDCNANLIKFYKGNDIEVYKYAIDKDVNLINYYKGNDIDIYKYALDKGFIVTKDFLINNSFISRNDELMNIIIKENPKLIVYYIGDNLDEMLSLTDYPKDRPWESLKFYRNDRLLFINNYHLLENILSLSNINIDKFIQYSLASFYDWIKDIIYLYNNNKVEEFIKVRDYFNKYYYKNNTQIVSNINNFNDILKNYIRYPELCLSIITKDKLSDNDIRKIEFLFNRKEILSEKDKPRKLEDFSNIANVFKEKYINLSLDKDLDIESIKDIICNLLFNDTYENIEYYLETYGNTMEMKKLRFNDRNSYIISSLIDEIIIFTSIMESITTNNNKDDLIDILKKLITNFDLSMECSIYFNQYESKIRYLYEVDLNETITNVSLIKDYSKYLDKKLTNMYGVDVIDFSDKAYLLLTHVQNTYSETVEELVSGTSSSKRNFICLSGISYRNQVYYWGGNNKIIFGYDNIPEGSFIASSVSNMGSNGKIHNNSSDVDTIARTQRGLLETSSAPQRHNSEILCFREGLKPSYIILPKRDATSKEIEIAKKYNLKFIKTQEKNTMIENPSRIEYIDETDFLNNKVNIEELTKLRNVLLETIAPKKNHKRKIAIFSDAHALYEPTLSILEDARLNGINEIYSLGDNIGTGPNPKEVLDLLEEYNVKSIMGNHELYVLLGVDKFTEHFNRTGGYKEAKLNSTWTRNQLTNKEISNIKLYPKTLELKFGGKKILLCHSIKDFNTDKLTINRGEFDKVLQGHIHFEDDKDNIHTLRGAGIGTPDIGKAHYLILTETDTGFDIEKKYIKYDINNLQHSINISTLNNRDKEKINNWSGVVRRR